MPRSIVLGWIFYVKIGLMCAILCAQLSAGQVETFAKFFLIKQASIEVNNT